MAAIHLFDSNDLEIASYATLLEAVTVANADAGTDYTITIEAGTVELGGAQVVINKNISISGAGTDDTTLHIDFNTGTTGDPRGAILVNAAGSLSLSNLTYDGTGSNVWNGIRANGDTDIDEVHFSNIDFHSAYAGSAVAGLTGAVLNITNSEFTDIGRIGAHYAGANGNFEGNTYTGKGAVDALDYAMDISRGAVVTVTDNTVINNTAVAISDGSTSAGFLVSDFFGPSPTVTFTGNTVSGNTVGLAGGYLDTDASTIHFGAGNDFTGNDFGLSLYGNVTATNAEAVTGDFYWEGGTAANAITGAGSADTLIGGGGDDTITGNGGNDEIDGGNGTDVVVYSDAATITQDGLTGWTVTSATGGTDTLTNIEQVNDSATGKILLVGNGGYASIEAAINAAASGDTIRVASGTWTLPGTLLGGSENDLLLGGGDNDTLDGGTGADQMFGGTGNDTYTVDDAGDIVSESSAQGTDTVHASVSYALTGGDGLDSFVFSSTLNGTTNVDSITDFVVADNSFNLKTSVFTTLSAGTLDAGAFVTGTGAGDATDRIIYDNTTGDLFYDADGSGVCAQVKFAHVTPLTALTNNDFIIS